MWIWKTPGDFRMKNLVQFLVGAFSSQVGFMTALANDGCREFLFLFAGGFLRPQGSLPVHLDIKCRPCSSNEPVFHAFRRWRAIARTGITSLFLLIAVQAAATPFAIDPQIQIRQVLSTVADSGSKSVRIAKNPRNSELYYLKANGDIYQVNLAPDAGSTALLNYTAADHGLSTSVEGFAIGSDGTMYVVGNIKTNSGNSNWVRIMKGVQSGAGRKWTTLAETQTYPLSKTAYDRLANGLVVSPDGQWLFANFGSRTDHGEIESTGGVYPNLRETALTAKILRLPTSGQNLVLTNDLAALKSAGYVFAEGTRNAFDLGFAPNGDLFATDNGPDRDMSDELNWLQEGHHYGFPWRMGGADNPQQFPDYDPAQDHLLDMRCGAVKAGTCKNDPTFPKPSALFSEPVINLGPNANCWFLVKNSSRKAGHSVIGAVDFGLLREVGRVRHRW